MRRDERRLRAILIDEVQLAAFMRNYKLCDPLDIAFVRRVSSRRRHE
jgi:hypothetical protein